MGTIGYSELLIIFLIVLLLFGGRKIPEIARGLGKGIHEFKKARNDFQDAIEREVPDTVDTTASAVPEGTQGNQALPPPEKEA